MTPLFSPFVLPVDQVLARETSGGTVAWYLPDRLGTIRDIVDNTGAIIDHVDYSAYGKVLSESAPSVGDRLTGFAGLDRDTATGLNLAVYRAQDPGTGRWLSEDPKGFMGGDANVYRYVANDPIGAVDPAGLQEAAGGGYIVIPFGGGPRRRPFFGRPFIGGWIQIQSPDNQYPTPFDPNRNPWEGPTWPDPVRPFPIMRPDPSRPMSCSPVVGPPFNDPFSGGTVYPLYYYGRPGPIPGILCNDGRVYPSIGGKPYPYLTSPGYIYLPSEKPTLDNPPTYAPK